MILVLDYGSQYTQLIARRIRDKQVYAQIVPFDQNLSHFQKEVEGVVLSGGPSSVYEGKAPWLPKEILDWNVPILGICYGAQLLVHSEGGKVVSSSREFGKASLQVNKNCELFFQLGNKSHQVWMSHGDEIQTLPSGYEAVASSEGSPYATFVDAKRNRYGVQFHPEVSHTLIGSDVWENFLFRVCKAKPNWTMEHFISKEIKKIQEKVGKSHVLCALSGGVDSSVVALLLHRAIGNQLTCVFVDTGFLRKGEKEEVVKNFRDHFHVDLRVIEAAELFYAALKGVEDPETKRKTCGRLFIEEFEKEAKKIPGVKFLAQGTLYPDVIESASTFGPSVTIKTHHNVGGLPEKMNLALIEPVRELFKDEVRKVGKELGLSDVFVKRHPFPGPGLLIRILGEATPDRAKVLQEADAIFISELRTCGLYDEVWQAFAVLLPVRSVGVMGDYRTYENVCALRAVQSTDGMTADWASLPHEFLGKCANRIINEVRGINRVVYDISSKPPATIEWE